MKFAQHSATPRRGARNLALGMTLAFLTAVSGGVASAQEPFYADKTIEIIIASGPGSGQDGFARMTAPFLSKHIEGNPTVQVTNIPGGANISGINDFFLQREHDGMTLTMMGGSNVIPYILGDANVLYDLTKMVPLLAVTQHSRVAYYRSELGIKTVEDLKDTDVVAIYGSEGPTGIDMINLLGWEIMGLSDKNRYVFGYDSSPALTESFITGETNLGSRSSANFIRDDWELVENGAANLVYSFGVPDGKGGLKRDPLLPELPHAGEVAVMLRGESPSGPAWDSYLMLLDFLVTGAHSMWTHKAAPPEAIAALQAGFKALFEDEEYRALYKDYYQHDAPLLGAEAQSWGDSLSAPNADNIAFIKQFLTENFEVSFDK